MYYSRNTNQIARLRYPCYSLTAQSYATHGRQKNYSTATIVVDYMPCLLLDIHTERQQLIIIIMVIFHCYFFRGHIALPLRRCEHKIRKTNRLKALCMMQNNI